MTRFTNSAKATMTASTAATANTANTAETPMSRDEVKKMLRDAAFVLQMTRRVKAEIVADRAETAKTAAAKGQEITSGLGV